MKAAIKIFAALLGIIVLAVSALVGYVLFILDPNDYKPALIDVVKQKTDMDLRLDGQLAWQLYPNIGLSLGKMGLHDPQLNETLLAVEQASVSVKLMPLFSGEAQIDAVNLDGGDVRFMQLADGKTSWDNLIAKLKSPDEEEPSQPVKFDVQQLSISKTQLTLEDRVAKVTRQVSGIEVAAEGIGPNQAFPLTAAFVFKQAAEDGKSLTAANALSAQVNINMDSQKPEVSALQLTSALSGNLLPAPVDIKLEIANILADLVAKKHQVDGVKAQLTYQDPARKEPLVADLSANILADLPQGRIDVAELALGAMGLTLKGKVRADVPALANAGTDIMSGLLVTGDLASNTVSPRELMTAAGIAIPATASADVLKRLAVQTRLRADANSVLLSPLQITLDGSNIHGEAGVKSLSDGRLFARLTLDKINIDHYLPPAAPAAKAEEVKPAASKAKKAAEQLLPVDLLRTLNFDVALKAGALTVVTYPIQDLRVTAMANGGLINVSEFKGRVADGSFSVPVLVDVRGAQPVITLKPRLDRINLGPIAKQALNKDVFDGRMNFNGSVVVRGNDADAWLRSAQGPNTLSLNEGVIKGVNVTDALFNALGQYQVLLPMLIGKDVATIKQDIRNTPINTFLGEMTLNQGTVKNESMKADLQDVQIGGSGTYNLLTQDVDYRFQLKLDPKFWSEKHKKMADYPIPVRCNGNLNGPLMSLCGLDQQGMQALMGQVAKERLNEEVGKQQQRLQDKINEKLKPAEQEAVKQLFQIFQR